VLLVRWYDVTKWFLERVDGFPKNQRFIFGQRLVAAAIDILDLLVEAAYRKEKREVLVRANLRLERLRWLVRLAGERGAFHRPADRLRRRAFSGGRPHAGRMVPVSGSIG